MLFNNTGKYLFIDTLYVNDFTNYPTSITQDNIVRLRGELFPDAYDPFAIIDINTSEFVLDNIQYLEFEQTNTLDLNQFCSDSGMILVIKLNVFDSFRKDFNADKFIESINNPHLYDYWINVQNEYKGNINFFYTSDISPDFAGGGNFIINTLNI